MPKSKKTQENTQKEEELRGKIKSMAGIIEELSNVPSDSGDSDKVLDEKIGHFDEKFGSQIDQLKGSLSEIEKKVEKPTKIKDELDVMLKDLEDKMQPKFSEVDEKLKTLSKIEDIERTLQGLSSIKDQKDNDVQATKEELGNLKEGIKSLSKTNLEIKEQLRDLDRLPILERKLQVESVLDPQDITRLEKVISAVDQMVPKKIVDEKLRLFLENSKEFQKQMLRQGENLAKDFINHVSKLEDRVEIIFKLQKSYAEVIEKKIEDMFSDYRTYFESNLEQLKKSLTSSPTKRGIEEFRKQMDDMYKKNYSMMVDLEKSIGRRALKGEMGRVKKDIQENFESTRDHIDSLNDEMASLKKIVTSKDWTKRKLERETSDLRALNYRLQDKLDKLEKKMDYQKSLVLSEFKVMSEEKRRLNDVVRDQKRKIGSILKKMV